MNPPSTSIFWPPVAHAEALTAPPVRLTSAWRDPQLKGGEAASRFLREREAPTVTLAFDAVLAPEAYHLEINSQRPGARIRARDGAGLFYGALTFCQWVEAWGQRNGDGWLVPPLCVEDAPGLAVRGVMLDISRDRVPTLETLFSLVDLLACFKINQLQLYLEHAFAYTGHEVVWRDASPFTREEFEQLDAYCRARHVALVPNQNSLGHFHRWLVHDDYRSLAECPEGIEHPFSQGCEPYGLCVTDERVFALLEDLYDQLLPCFSIREFNVGLDEAFDLGRCRSAAAADAYGKEALYLHYLERVHALVAARGHRMQFWADGVQSSPDAIAGLPADTTALVWGYAADHDFQSVSARFATAKQPFYVCPGTSSWNSLLGRNTVALSNLQRAAAAAAEHRAAGMLITDWGDNGHLQPLPSSFFGLTAGAALAWAPRTSLQREEVACALSRHVFFDAEGGLGEALTRLGDAHERCGPRLINSAYPFNFVVRHDFALDAPALAGVSVVSLEACEAELVAGLAALQRARSPRDDTALVKQELRWAADLLLLGCRLGRARLKVAGPVEAIGQAQRQPLAATLKPLITEHERLWLARSRAGGRGDSRRRLEALLLRLEA
ncbi:MAG: family 20 glycosylhydrolase [Deltaproteobacteria bacterium]|nr:family 20 glycosylhydrolase [Deltaproteobacteria bacterium]